MSANIDEKTDIERVPFTHIATGGTIDSEWVATKDTVLASSYSHAKDYLKRLGLKNVTYKKLSNLKDSRDLSWGDFSEILSLINSSRERILLTTGTYNMPAILSLINAHASDPNKDIIVTGAMSPLTFSESDGGFNLGLAISRLQTAISGKVELVMNGRIYDGSQGVVKDIAAGQFYSVRDFKNPNAYSDFPRNIFDLGGSFSLVLTDAGSWSIPKERRDAILPNYFGHVFGDMAIAEMLWRYNFGFQDVREFDLEDQEILSAIKRRESAVIITCNLSNLAQIHEELNSRIRSDDLKIDLKDKVLILVAARTPIKYIPGTDATFQLGYAFGQSKNISQPGVYVAFDGVTYGPGETESLKKYLEDKFHPQVETVWRPLGWDRPS